MLHYFLWQESLGPYDRRSVSVEFPQRADSASCTPLDLQLILLVLGS
jgi:hypothetical protein